MDYNALSNTLASLLFQPEQHGLDEDDDGWVSLAELQKFLPKKVVIENILKNSSNHGYELNPDGTHIRITDEWVPLRGNLDVDLQNQPRRLTMEEIDFITSHVPYAMSADPTAAEVARNGVVAWIRNQLLEISLEPNAVGNLKDQIVIYHFDSLVIIGSAEWTISATAEGATLTQMALNSFHSSGSSKSVSVGIEPLKEIISAKAELSNESCTIYYNNKEATYEEVLDSRSYIVGTNVGDLIKDFDIDAPSTLKQYWWHGMSQALLGKTAPQSAQVLRLYLNLVEMYKQKVTIADIVRALEQDSVKGIVCIYGPMSDGILDIYPRANVYENLKEFEHIVAANTVGEKYQIAKAKDDKERGDENPAQITHDIPQDLAERVFLSDIVYDSFATLRVKGIKNIKSIHPVISPVWRMVINEKKHKGLTSEEKEYIVLNQDLGYQSNQVWDVFYNRAIMRQTGLVEGNLAALCELAGIGVIGEPETHDRLIVVLPNDCYTTYDGDSVLKVDGKFYRLISASKQEGSYTRTIDDEDIIVVDKYIPASAFTKLNYSKDQITELLELTFVKLGDQYFVRPDWNTKNYNAIDARHQEDDKKITNLDEIDKFIKKNALQQEGYLETLSARGNDEAEKDKVREFVSRSEIKNINDEYIRTVDPKLLYFKEGKTNATSAQQQAVYELIVNKKIEREIRALRPNEYVNQKVARDKRERDEKIKQNAKDKIKGEVPRTPLMKAAEFVIADTVGSNLKELLALPNVDKTRTVCNNLHAIRDALGIEAAYAYGVKLLSQINTNSGSYVHPIHVMNIIEFICSRGRCYGPNFTGISRQPGGHLSLASLEKAGKVFTSAALPGKKEFAGNVSAAIVMGVRAPVGTGVCDVAQDITIDGQQRTFMNDELFDCLQYDDESIRIKEQGLDGLGPVDYELRYQKAKGEEGTVDDVLAGIEALGLNYEYTDSDLAWNNKQGEMVSTVTKEGVSRRTPSKEKTALMDDTLFYKVGRLTEQKVVEPESFGILGDHNLSGGLVTDIPDIERYGVDIDVPVDLMDMLNEYTQIKEEEKTKALPEEVAVVKALPVSKIRVLPSLSGVVLKQGEIAERREVVDVKPIDVESLANALGK
jgi:hypothetical protein